MTATPVTLPLVSPRPAGWPWLGFLGLSSLQFRRREAGNPIQVRDYRLVYGGSAMWPMAPTTGGAVPQICRGHQREHGGATRSPAAPTGAMVVPT